MPRDPNKPPRPGLVTRDQLAALFRVGHAQIQEWYKAGLVVRAATGWYDPVESTGRVVQHLSAVAAGRKAGLGALGQDGGPDVAMEGALLKRSQRELNEIAIAEKRGDLISRAAVKNTWTSIARVLRANVMGIATKVAFELPHLTAHDREVIKEACADALTDGEMMRDDPPLPGRALTDERANGQH